MYEIIYIPNFRKIVRKSMHVINTLIDYLWLTEIDCVLHIYIRNNMNKI